MAHDTFEYKPSVKYVIHRIFCHAFYLQEHLAIHSNWHVNCHYDTWRVYICKKRDATNDYQFN